MSKFTRDVLGSSAVTEIDGTQIQGSILALSTCKDNQQFCFLPTGAKMGMWVSTTVVEIEGKIPSQGSKQPKTKVTNIQKINKEVEANKSLLLLRENANETAWNQLIDWIGDEYFDVQFDEALTSVDRLIKRSRNKSKYDITHELILHKSMQAAGCELIKDITTFLNTLFSAMGLGNELITLPRLAKLAAEMVYQIARIYGYDSYSLETKLEALTIFGMTCMSENAVEVGLDWLVVEKALNKAMKVTAKAAMIYAIGNLACFFYEYKQELKGISPLTQQDWLDKQFKQETQNYLTHVISEKALKEEIKEEYEDNYYEYIEILADIDEYSDSVIYVNVPN